ncbi:MAG TPA: glycosyltransferase family 87 protein [Candidatus Limnocylindria bacterium]|nr:glycosyltransferase family 87 protein [Candidatus Limnocylindria bacterium]
MSSTEGARTILESALRRGIGRPAARLSRIVAIAVLLGMAVSHLRWMIADWSLHDMNVYWDAAIRLRDGEPLYVAVNPLDVYRYAPWFAYAWVPLTYLPKPVVDVGWSVLLLVASALAIVPLIRIGTTPALILALLFGPLLFAISSIGNIQPLMVLALTWGIPRRSGPVWIALFASLKAVPLAFVLVYVARREWVRVIVTVLLTAVLVAPILAHEIPAEVLSPGDAAHLTPPVYLALAGAAGVAALVAAWKRSRWTPFLAAIAAVTGLPRLFMYEVSTLLVGTLGAIDDPPRR